MAEQLVFARKASGLVRGLDMWDAFGAGLMTCQPIATLWLMVGIALSLYPTGNLLISIAIGAVTAGIGAPARLGHPQRLHAARRRRVRLQLAHPAPRDRSGRRVLQHHRHLLLELVHRHVARCAGPAAVRPVHGLVGLRRLVRLQRRPRRPRPDRRHRRLRLRGLQHEELRADPEDHAHPRHRRRDRADRRALPRRARPTSSATGTRSRPSTSRCATRSSSRRPVRCPTRGTGAARSAPSAASTRCSSTTTRSRT